MISKIKGFVDVVDCMELRTSIRVHANSSPTADTPAILVITEEEVFTASEVRAMLKEFAYDEYVDDFHQKQRVKQERVFTIAAKNGIQL